MGYSRAVRSGNTIAVTGCVGINADGTYAATVAEQTARSLAIIQAAIEALGLHPRLVPGAATNIKVTYPEDMALAAAILSAREEDRCE